MCHKPKHLDPEILRAKLNYDPVTGRLSLKEANQRTPAGHVYTTREAGNYIMVPYKKGLARAHRAAYVMMTGKQPDWVDHINGLPHDNRWCNLRNVSQQENARNTKASRKKLGTYISLEEQGEHP